MYFSIRPDIPGLAHAVARAGRGFYLGYAELVSEAGVEEGVDSIGGSCIIAPSGEVVARCLTKGDEVAIARCDLDFCAVYKRTTFNFDLHRQPHAYGLIVERKGETLAADGSPLSAPPTA